MVVRLIANARLVAIHFRVAIAIAVTTSAQSRVQRHARCRVLLSSIEAGAICISNFNRVVRFTYYDWITSISIYIENGYCIFRFMCIIIIVLDQSGVLVCVYLCLIGQAHLITVGELVGFHDIYD